MIFIDSIYKGTMLVIHLQNLLPEYMQSDRKRLIGIFSLILKLDTKSEYQEDFCNGDTRISICTDATWVAVDIENIV